MTITVFSKPACVQCNSTKNWLKAKGVPFIERDITTDPAAFAEVKRLGYSSMPVVYKNGDTNWFGHRPDMLMGLVD